MQRGASTIAASGLSQSQQESIGRALREILDCSHFAKSRRYSAMLEYVVQNSIEGNLTALKERMVGSAVFGRPADYDVANDPVVRIAAGEVRKRLSQYFSEHPGSEVRIELPAGGYVAEFLLGPHSVLPGSGDILPEVSSATPTAVSVAAGKQRSAVAGLRMTRTAWITLAAVLAIALAATWADLSYQVRRDFWRPVLKGPQPAVIVVGKKDISSTSDSGSSHLATAGRTYLSFNDTMLVAQINFKNPAFIGRYRFYHEYNAVTDPVYKRYKGAGFRQRYFFKYRFLHSLLWLVVLNGNTFLPEDVDTLFNSF